MFLLKFSLLSKTVPRYLYSVTLPTFTPSIKRSGMTVGAFLKSVRGGHVIRKRDRRTDRDSWSRSEERVTDCGKGTDRCS